MTVPRSWCDSRSRFDHDRLLAYIEAPAEAKNGSGLARLADETEKAMCGPTQMFERPTRWSVEQSWRQAKPAEWV